MVGRMVGGIRDLEVESDSDDYDDDEEDEEEYEEKASNQNNKSAAKSGGVFSMFRFVSARHLSNSILNKNRKIKSTILTHVNFLKFH